MHRFFVSPDCISGDVVTLSGDVARQLARVLRSRPGDQVVLLDNSGWEHLVTLESVRADQARGLVAERRPNRGEPTTKITLYQGVLKTDRFEFVLQKGTELGVYAFVPVLCVRSVPRERGKPGATNRYARWRKIITEAAEQSHRGRVPTLEEPTQFASACDRVQGLAVIPWEREDGMGLKAALARWKADRPGGSSVSVFVGPEGGFTQGEIDGARDKGIVPVSLGSRILRAETAGIVAAALILYELGDLGG